MVQWVVALKVVMMALLAGLVVMQVLVLPGTAGALSIASLAVVSSASWVSGGS